MLIVRAATPLDIADIAALHVASWRATYRGALSDEYLETMAPADRLALWRARLSNPAPSQHVLVAEHEGTLVGFICLYDAHDPQWGTLIDNLHVHQSFKRRGIGARLMTEAADWCRARHPSQGLYLWVLDMNGAAQTFYRHLGATQADAAIWSSPDGGAVPQSRYFWQAPDIMIGRDVYF